MTETMILCYNEYEQIIMKQDYMIDIIGFIIDTKKFNQYIE